jgi:hypothetical protein
VQEQQREQLPRLRAAQRQPTAVGDDLERPEDPELARHRPTLPRRVSAHNGAHVAGAPLRTFPPPV